VYQKRVFGRGCEGKTRHSTIYDTIPQAIILLFSLEEIYLQNVCLKAQMKFVAISSPYMYVCIYHKRNSLLFRVRICLYLSTTNEILTKERLDPFPYGPWYVPAFPSCPSKRNRMISRIFPLSSITAREGCFMRPRHHPPIISFHLFLSLSLFPPSIMLPRLHPRRRDPRRHRHRLPRDTVLGRAHRRAVDLEAAAVRVRVVLAPPPVVHVADLRAVRRGEVRRRAHEAHLLLRARAHRACWEGGQGAPRGGARSGW